MSGNNRREIPSRQLSFHFDFLLIFHLSPVRLDRVIPNGFKYRRSVLIEGDPTTSLASDLYDRKGSRRAEYLITRQSRGLSLRGLPVLGRDSTSLRSCQRLNVLAIVFGWQPNWRASSLLLVLVFWRAWIISERCLDDNSAPWLRFELLLVAIGAILGMWEGKQNRGRDRWGGMHTDFWLDSLCTFAVLVSNNWAMRLVAELLSVLYTASCF